VVSSGIAELPLVGGHPALDLVNTVEPRLPAAGRHDHLATPQALLIWAERAGLADEHNAAGIGQAWSQDPAAAASALASVIRIREALFTALAAGLGPDHLLGPDYAGPPTEQALDYLSLRWSAAAARSSLSLGRGPAGPDGADGAGARLIVGSAPALLIPDRAAVLAIDLLCHTDLTRLGICPPEHEGCAWLFLDRSRNGSRRWCTMEACGSFAKARRLTERRRADRAPS
jgi:predicted RNA-binding Zn ribbon-like protein